MQDPGDHTFATVLFSQSKNSAGDPKVIVVDCWAEICCEEKIYSEEWKRGLHEWDKKGVMLRSSYKVPLHWVSMSWKERYQELQEEPNIIHQVTLVGALASTWKDEIDKYKTISTYPVVYTGPAQS